MSTLPAAYLATMSHALKGEVQYRFGLLMWILGLAVEPIVYLVVWQTVAEARGGMVAGFDSGDFAAYYLVWIVVRVMNIALTPWAFEARVQRGQLSPMLLRPVHPFHVDLATFIPMKLVTLGILAPIIAILWLVFQPTLDFEWVNLLLFAIAIWTGFLMRFVLVWALGLISFWVVRVGGIFDLYFAAELLLSGRLVPLGLLPPWARDLSDLLPFKYSFGFPIEVMLGRASRIELVAGFAMQALWTLVGLVALVILWKRGVKRYSAVGA